MSESRKERQTVASRKINMRRTAVRKFTCPVNDFQTQVRRKFHCSVVVTLQLSLDILMTFHFMIFLLSLRCYPGTLQTPVRLNKFLLVCWQHLLTTTKAQVRKNPMFHISQSIQCRQIAALVSLSGRLAVLYQGSLISISLISWEMYGN